MACGFVSALFLKLRLQNDPLPPSLCCLEFVRLMNEGRSEWVRAAGGRVTARAVKEEVAVSSNG